MDENFKEFLRLQNALFKRHADAFISISDELKAGIRAGNATQKTARLGNSVTIDGTQAMLDSIVNATSYGLLPEFGTNRLLTVSEGDKLTENPGSWVLSLRGEVTDDDTVAGAGIPSLPLVAQIRFGAGGVQQYAEVDAWSSVIAIPSQTLEVDIVAQNLGDLSDAFFEPDLYKQVRVTGTLQRSQETGEGIPTRSYFVGDHSDVVTVPVPPFAASWGYITAGAVTSGSLPLTQAKMVTGPGGLVLDNPVPEMLESMVRTSCFRPVPPYATQLEIEASGLSFLGAVVFRIGL